MKKFVVLRDSMVFDDCSTFQEALKKAEQSSAKQCVSMVVCEVINRINAPVTSTKNNGNDIYIFTAKG